ncbi:MAG: PD-(D/E)XK nuclease family protein [Syntrophomonas sp.]
MNNPQTIEEFINEFTAFSNEHEILKIEEAKRNFQNLFLKFKEVDLEIRTKNEETSCLFNPLDLFVIDENKISELLAFLLNPNSSHGQGDIYLQEFHNHFEIGNSFHDAVVETEHVTNNNRRIDIFIQTDESYIIIENKYNWASDQDNQLNDYFEYARNKNLESEGHNIYCFYLTPDKEFKKPTKSSKGKIPESKLFIKDFNSDISSFLEKCREISKNVKMRLFINDLISLIKKENKMDEYQKEIFEWLSEDESRVKHAQQISNIWNAFRFFLLEETSSQLMENLKDSLNKLSNDKEWKVMFDGDFRRPYSGIKITKKQWNDKYSLYLQSDWGSFNNNFLLFTISHEHLLEKEKELGMMIAKELSDIKVDFTKPGEGIAWKWSKVRDTSNEVERFSRNKREIVIDIWTNEIMSFINILEQEEIKGKITELACT